MERKFTVGDIAYVVSYDDNVFTFFIDVFESRRTNLYELDEFARGFGDDPPDRIYAQVDAYSAFKVKSEVMDFVHMVIRKERPYYFHFSANEDIKIRLYHAVAERIANQYGYDLVVDGRYFNFFHNKPLAG